jgi:hypothetical protein
LLTVRSIITSAFQTHPLISILIQDRTCPQAGVVEGALLTEGDLSKGDLWKKITYEQSDMGMDP